MNVDIYVLRDFIQTYGLYMQITALIAFTLLKGIRHTFFYCSLLVILVGLTHFLIENQLQVLGQNPRYEQLVYNLWYLGFASTDALFILLTIYISQKKQLVIDSVSRMLMISYFCLGSMQVARYFDRIIIETDWLGNIYSVVIPTINVGITFIVCSYVISLALNAFFRFNTRK